MDMQPETFELSKLLEENEDELFETERINEVHQPMDVAEEQTDKRTDNQTDMKTGKTKPEPRKSAMKEPRSKDKLKKEDVTEAGDINDVDDEVGEEEEEEEEDNEMRLEDKQAAYNAVKAGDIDLLEDVLDKPNSDINMTLFNENLLMTAIRANEPEMAEFLLDNGVDHNFKTSLITVNEIFKNRIEWRKYSCRQMAYDKELDGVVEIIDIKNNNLFSFVKPRERVPRYRRPKPPTPEPDSSSDEEQSEEDSLLPGQELNTKHKKSVTSLGEDVDGTITKLRTRKESSLAKEIDDDVKMELSDNYDNDSGHNTFFSSPEVDHRGYTENSEYNYGYGHGSAAFLFRGLDEGYGTMSFKSSMCVTPSIKHSREKKKLQIPIRGTRSFTNLQKSVVNRQLSNAHIRDHCEKPLLWKKVQMCGSYVTESPMWHVDNPQNMTRPNTEPVISKQCYSAPPVMSKQSVDMKPRKTKSEPHYARLTNSAYTKRKLIPTFTRAYSDLDFVKNPSAEKISSFTDVRSTSKPSRTYTNTKPSSVSYVKKEAFTLGSNAINVIEIGQKIYSIPPTTLALRNEKPKTDNVRNGYHFTNKQFPQRQRSIKAW